MAVDAGYAMAWRFEQITDRDKLVSNTTTTVWGVTSKTGTDNVMQEILLTKALRPFITSISFVALALVNSF